MSTFTDEDPQKKEITVKSEMKTEWDQYLEGLSKVYVERCKEQAKLTSWDINIRNEATGEDVSTKFSRKHLTNRQLDEIESLRISADDLRKADKGSKEQREASGRWYKKIASCILWNVKDNRPMSEDDYDNAVIKDIRAILDGCIMSEMSGVPN